MNDKIILYVIIGIAIFVGIYYIFIDGKKEQYFDVNGYISQVIPTSKEVEFIEGEPDMHVVNAETDMEVIHPGDIALSPGLGVGEGTVGFGRYGASFIM